MKINLIIERLFIVFKVDSHAALALKLGVSATTISNWKKRNTIDYELIFTKCEGVNLNWLILGIGSMLMGVGESLYLNEPHETYNPTDKIIQALSETVEVQKKYTDFLENEIRRLKDRGEEVRPGDTGQKRKAG